MTIPSWAKRGQKVVFIDATTDPGRFWVFPEEVPQLNGVYTIERIISGRLNDHVVVLEEIKRIASTVLAGQERGFAIWRFRPLVTRTIEQDMEQFLPLLKPSPNLTPATDDEVVNALAHGAVFGKGRGL